MFRAKPNVPFVRLAKIVFTNVRREKNKKHLLGLCVGLLAVSFQFGLNILGHLSKWFVYVLMFNFMSVVVLGTVVLPLAITYRSFA